MRGAIVMGCREQMLFIAYSALVQVDRSTAAVRLQEINERFTDPLPQAELDHIIQETDQSVGMDHKGFIQTLQRLCGRYIGPHGCRNKNDRNRPRAETCG